jgi:hypothetical protein
MASNQVREYVIDSQDFRLFLKFNVGDEDIAMVLQAVRDICGDKVFVVDCNERAWIADAQESMLTWLASNVPAQLYFAQSDVGLYFFTDHVDAIQFYLTHLDRMS